MMRSTTNGMALVTIGLLAGAAVVLGSHPATAAISCSQGYQRVQGNQLATPYCQDEYLAQVARSYGVKATGTRIRNNPSYKSEVCRLVGRDIRVQQVCVNENTPFRSRGF